MNPRSPPPSVRGSRQPVSPFAGWRELFRTIAAITLGILVAHALLHGLGFVMVPVE